MDEKVLEIILNITGFVTYFVPGYIYIACFNYCSCRNRESEIKHLVIKSIAISYFIYVIISAIGKLLKLDSQVVQILTFIFAVLLGLVFGRISRTIWANKVSSVLFKREITNNLFVNLWEQANKEKCVVYVNMTMKDTNLIYEGQISRVSSYNDNPEITLAYYICFDNNMKVILDKSNSENDCMVVYYSDIKKFSYELISTNIK